MRISVESSRTARRGLGQSLAAALLLGGLWLAVGAPECRAQSGGRTLSPAEKLIQEEQLRESVEEAFRVAYSRVDDGSARVDNLMLATDQLVEIGPPALPYLIAELEQARPASFTFVAYALGRMGSAEAANALREAIAHADTEQNDWAQERKAWAVYALGLMGELDALELANSGQNRTAAFQIHMDASVLELSALFCGPQSVPVLLGQLERYAAAEADLEETRRDPWRDREAVIEALGALADPRSQSVLIDLLADPIPHIRRAAAYALLGYDTPEAVTALLDRLTNDDHQRVRYAAAWTLEQRLPASGMETFLARMELESDVHVRNILYRIVARLGGVEAYPRLTAQLGAPDSRDREGLTAALRLSPAPGRLATLRANLNDDDAKVARQAIRGLAEIGTRPAVDALIRTVTAENWAVAGSAVRALIRLDEPRAAPPIAERMLKREMVGVVTDPVVRERIYLLGDALLELRQSSVLPELRTASERQRDGFLVRYLERLVLKLELLERNGAELDAWVELMDSADEELRELAYEEVGRIGGEPAAAALAARFGRVELDEGREILRVLGGVDAPASRALLERVLLSPSFDRYPRVKLRAEAAWSARRIGDAAMIALLEQSAERRQGREGKVLVYLAVSSGEKGTAMIERYRLTRLRYLGWSRWWETETLDKIVRDSRAGRPLTLFDVPPAELEVGRNGWSLTH
jgi:HEAT repeat protein